MCATDGGRRQLKLRKTEAEIDEGEPLQLDDKLTVDAEELERMKGEVREKNVLIESLRKRAKAKKRGRGGQGRKQESKNGKRKVGGASKCRTGGMGKGQREKGAQNVEEGKRLFMQRKVRVQTLGALSNVAWFARLLSC